MHQRVNEERLCVYLTDNLSTIHSSLFPYYSFLSLLAPVPLRSSRSVSFVEERAPDCGGDCFKAHFCPPSTRGLLSMINFRLFQKAQEKKTARHDRWARLPAHKKKLWGKGKPHTLWRSEGIWNEENWISSTGTPSTKRRSLDSGILESTLLRMAMRPLC